MTNSTVTKHLWIALLALAWAGVLVPSHAAAESGRVFDNLSMRTKILGGERRYAIYLPPDYDTSERHYPILYLMHGAGDDHTGWVQFGEVLHIVDLAIRDGSATPMIIAMPDGQTGRLGFFNDPQGKWRYEDYFFNEFMPLVESNYRVKREKRFRAISGLSMGGGAAYIYAMRHPKLFAAAAPLSAATGLGSPELYREIYPAAADIDDPTLEAFLERYDALKFAANMPVDELKSVSWYIDCGDDDMLFYGNAYMHITFRNREVPHEYRVRDGDHNWTYWRESLPAVLRFVSREFHQY